MNAMKKVRSENGETESIRIIARKVMKVTMKRLLIMILIMISILTVTT